MIETKEKTIDGSVYAVTQFPAMKALRMQAKLGKYLGPSLSLLYVSEMNGNSDEKIPMALKMLFEQLDENTFESLTLELLQCVRENGVELTKPIIDLKFAGKLNLLFKVLVWVLEVNYADFFQENGVIQDLLGKTK